MGGGSREGARGNVIYVWRGLKNSGGRNTSSTCSAIHEMFQGTFHNTHRGPATTSEYTSAQKEKCRRIPVLLKAAL